MRRVLAPAFALILGILAGKFWAERGKRDVFHRAHNAKIGWLEELHGDLSPEGVYGSFRRGYALDREYVLEQLNGLSSERKRHAIAGLVTEAARTDLAMLLELIESLPVDSLIVTGAFETAARQQLDHSLKMLESLQDKWKEAASSGISLVIGERPLEDAFKILAKVGDQKLQRLLMRSIAVDYAYRGEFDVLSSSIGERLRQWVPDTSDPSWEGDIESMEDGGIFTDLEVLIVETMAQKDPLLAARWIHDGNTDIVSVASITPFLFNEPASVIMEVLAYAEDRKKAMMSLFAELPELLEDRVLELLTHEKDADNLRALE